MDPTLIFPNCYVHMQLTRQLSACEFLELSYSQWKQIGAVELERVALQGEASFALKLIQHKTTWDSVSEGPDVQEQKPSPLVCFTWHQMKLQQPLIALSSLTL